MRASCLMRIQHGGDHVDTERLAEQQFVIRLVDLFREPASAGTLCTDKPHYTSINAFIAQGVWFDMVVKLLHRHLGDEGLIMGRNLFVRGAACT